MSRIHEALKRAEQERSAQPAEAATSSAAKASVELPGLVSGLGAEAAGPTARVETPVRTHADQFLRFDDLWSACVVSPWKMSSSVSVFVGSHGSVGAEQFRTLRSRLYQIRDRTPLKTILVTSAVVSEGKTFVASNLAEVLARQRGCKVLLIDGDLRCSSLHVGFGTNMSPGLSDYLKGRVPETAAIQRGLEDYLCLMPGGTRAEDPGELLANGRLKTMLEKLRPVFDWVIIDSPPMLPVADAMLLADLSDGVIGVVRAAYTDLASAQKSCQQLQQKSFLGVVLNCADEDNSYGGYDAYSSQSQRDHAGGASSLVLS